MPATAPTTGRWQEHPGRSVFCEREASAGGLLARRCDPRPGRCLTPRPPPRRPSTTARPLEVTRTATDGTRNANSLLYGAAWRAAKALGYTRLITYTQASETGASLRGTGWRTVAERPARPGWTCSSRPRESKGAEHMPRTLWEAA
jgi:hypothetical protein